MEDVLEVYDRPYDPRRPLVCLDEAGKELRSHTRVPLPMEPGQPRRIDTEYGRHGSVSLFLAVAPHLGWRELWVREQRTGIDFALFLRHLADTCFPDADRIVLVLDNLNTHTAASLYRAFPAPEARRIWRRFEMHYTPKHGSWLNMAEPELSVLHRQCLARRMASPAEVAAAGRAWIVRRNSAAVTIDWSFTVEQARVRMPNAYPVPELEEDTIS